MLLGIWYYIGTAVGWVFVFIFLGFILYYSYNVIDLDLEKIFANYEKIEIGKSTKEDVLRLMKGIRPRHKRNGVLSFKYLSYEGWDGTRRKNGEQVDIEFDKDGIVTRVDLYKIKRK